MVRRERWGIVGAILAALEDEGQRGRDARITNVALRANLSYDRLQAYLEKLATNDMVTRDPYPRLTPKGREFLRHFRQWNGILDRFGIERL